MKVGVAAFITDEGVGPGRLGAAVEERGFHSLVVTEHSHIPVAYEEPYPGAGELPRDYHRTLDPFVALSSAAAVTRELVLTTGDSPAPAARRYLYRQGGHQPGLSL